MPGPVFRKGETVELRPIEVEDADWLQRLINDPRVRGTLMATDPVNRSEEEEWIEGIGEDAGVHLAVCADGDPVGSIGLNEPNEVWGTAEVGYLIDPDAWGNGYATDAVDAICGHAFEARRLEKVTAKVYANNPASRRVLEKVGFTEEGLLRQEAFVDGERHDVHRYGLLAEEWR